MGDQTTANGRSLVVVYSGKQVQLTFSDIAQIFPLENALERFVAELIQAVNVIRDIRTIQRAESRPDPVRALNGVLLEVTRVMDNWYGAIRTYATERLKSIGTSENLAFTAPETQAQVQFEAFIWGGIREIGHPLASLCALWTLIINEQGSQEELLSRFDIITTQLFELLQQMKLGKQL